MSQHFHSQQGSNTGLDPEVKEHGNYEIENESILTQGCCNISHSQQGSNTGLDPEVREHGNYQIESQKYLNNV